MSEPQAGFHLKGFDSAPLKRDPQDYFRDLFRDMRWVSPRGLQTWLRGQGGKLFEEIFPSELRRRLWQLRDLIRTVQIHSDEMWIPWELLRLPDPDDPSEGPFLVEAFSITRWPLIDSLPCRDLRMRRIALVVPRDPTLPGTVVEKERLKALGSCEREVTEIRAIYGEIREALHSGEFDGWHFAGHGETWGENHHRWRLVLEEGQLDPEHVYGARQIRKRRPLVFLNACHSGRGVGTLTGIGGLAGAFLEAGAGAFIGSQWELQDEQALCFAEELYRQLFSGAEIGEGVRRARIGLRDRFPDSSGWLAYTVFADPLACCATSPVQSQPKEKKASPAKSKSTLVPAKAPVPTEAPGSVKTGGSTGRTRKRRPVPEVSDEPRKLEAPIPGEERTHKKDGTVLVYVPGGELTLGADGIEWSKTVSRVQISPFWISRFPVTNEQYARYLLDNPGASRPEFWDNPCFNSPRHPVVGVSWGEALAYCRWAGLDLPSEVQWETAARGTDQRPYPWGAQPPAPLLANFGTLRKGTTLVDAFPAGCGPYGTFDQVGNVWEWCVDNWSFKAYQQMERGVRDPVTERDLAARALRGGAWTTPPRDLHAACRDRGTATKRVNDTGFRCVWCPA